jgi:hypothetical protein
MKFKTVKSNARGSVTLMMKSSFPSDCSSLCRYILQPYTYHFELSSLNQVTVKTQVTAISQYCKAFCGLPVHRS